MLILEIIGFYLVFKYLGLWAGIGILCLYGALAASK